jgi:hypothetical protein
MGAITAYPRERLRLLSRHLADQLSAPAGLAITNKGYPAKPLEAGATIYVKPNKAVDAPRIAFICKAVQSGGKCILAEVRHCVADGFNTTIVDFDSSTGSATVPYDTQGQSYVVLTTAYQGETLNDEK